MATDGRVIGQRARLTRRKLLDATEQLLAERGALDLKVIDIARAVGTSAATFYQYFEDVEDAIGALAEEVGKDTDSFAPHLAASWDGPDGLDHARALVSAFIDYWDAHQAVLRVRNLKAEENDKRFRTLRLQAYAALMGDLEAKTEAAQAAGRLPAEVNAYATAAAMVAVLERLIAFHREFERRGVQRDNMVETVARILFSNVTGRAS
jgi:AcrR family transcriptional regulator